MNSCQDKQGWMLPLFFVQNLGASRIKPILGSGPLDQLICPPDNPVNFKYTAENALGPSRGILSRRQNSAMAKSKI
jgi:hypothetical protein